MTWNSTSPRGDISVAANLTPMQQNTTFIQTTMGNDAVGTNAATTRDHFWNVDPLINGYHRHVKMPQFTVGGLPADPIIAASNSDGIIYSKLKLAAEAVDQQDVEPFFRNTGQVMQMLGIRAMAVFNVLLAAPHTVTIKYSHNVTSVTRTGEGFFTATYTNALPSTSYLALGGAIRNSSSTGSELLFEVQGANTLTNVKSTALLKFMTRSDGGTGHDPLQAWFVCFGG